MRALYNYISFFPSLVVTLLFAVVVIAQPDSTFEDHLRSAQLDELELSSLARTQKAGSVEDHDPFTEKTLEDLPDDDDDLPSEKTLQQTQNQSDANVQNILLSIQKNLIIQGYIQNQYHQWIVVNDTLIQESHDFDFRVGEYTYVLFCKEINEDHCIITWRGNDFSNSYVWDLDE